MKVCETIINDKKINFTHNNEDDIVNLFVETLEKQDKAYKIIEDGKTLQIGFNYYRIKKSDNNEYKIYSVDYHKNPLKDITEDLSLPLSIMKDQLLITKKTGLISDEVITFQDTLLVKKTSLTSPNVYFEKQQPKEGNDSGWYMGNLDDTEKSNNPEDYEMMILYKLLTVCPKALSILNLPVGSLAIIKNNEIVGISDSNNNEVYN